MNILRVDTKKYIKEVVQICEMSKEWHDQYMDLWARKILGYEYEIAAFNFMGALYILHPVLRGCDIHYNIGLRQIEVWRKRNLD